MIWPKLQNLQNLQNLVVVEVLQLNALLRLVFSPTAKPATADRARIADGAFRTPAVRQAEKQNINLPAFTSKKVLQVLQ